jgi:zinc protease
VNVEEILFFLRWYGPNNATLTIGGDVAATDVVKLVDKYFGGIPAGQRCKTNFACCEHHL